MTENVEVNGHVDRLEKAREQHDLVRIERSIIGADTLVGHVVAVGVQWMMLSVLDAGTPDGWVALRVSDIKAMHVAEGSRFVRRGLEHQTNWPPRAPTHPISLSSGTNALVLSAADGFALVTVFFERKDPLTFLIGRPGRLHRGYLEWQELTAAGSWNDHARRCELTDITRVEMGGQYQRALAHASYLRSLLDPAWNYSATSTTAAHPRSDSTEADPNMLLG